MPRDSRKSKCDKNRKSESSDSDSDSNVSYSSVSSKDVKVFVKSHHHAHKDHKHKKTESESESCSEHKSEESCSDKSKTKYCFDEIYKYYKYKLLTDDSLMVSGSSVYGTSHNSNVQTIQYNQAPTFLNNDLLNNIDHIMYDSPFCVRESGIYILFFIASVEQSSQFSVFINGVVNDLSTTGNNAGGGQTILRHMIQLQKDDTIVIRNYSSSSGSIVANNYIGGTEIGNNLTFLVMKIAALPNMKYDEICEKWDSKCLSKNKLHLYKKVLEKMLCDKELMLKGFNIHGSFYTHTQQSIATDTNLVFTNYINVSGLNWNSSNPDRINILEDGVYKVFFLTTTTTSAQFTICVNDVPLSQTTQGTNKGAGQLSGRHIIDLKKGDYITIKNHTSTNGTINISADAGGVLPSLSGLCTIFKIAPSVKPLITYCKLNNYHKKCYEKFRCFLLNNKCLQIMGAPAYNNYVTSTPQTLQVGDKYLWEVNTVQKNIEHKQVSTELIIQKDGMYDIFADVITAEPSQITLFINGVADPSTSFGRDSGANRTIMRQFIKLYKGDTVDVRNWKSASASVTTTTNSGGTQPGHPVFFMSFMLAPIDEDCYLKPSSKKSK